MVGDVHPARVDGSASSSSAAFENVAEFTFKSDQAGVEQFPLRYDHDVEPRRELVATKYLADQSFGPVPHHGAAQFPCGGDAQSAGLQAVRQPEQGEASAVNLDPSIVNLLVLCPSANPLATIESGHDRCPPHDAVVRLLPVTPRLFAADRQPLPSLGTTALQDQPAVLGGHANQKSVRLATTARIWLKRALTLHDLSGGRSGPCRRTAASGTNRPCAAACK